MKIPLTMKAAAPAPTATAGEAGLSDLSPEQRALLMLRLRRKAAEKGEEGPPPIPRAPREGDLPLSFAQQRLWFLDQLEPGNPAYNIPAAVRLSGALDVAAFGRAVTEMVRRHEVLRTTFPEAGGEPRQEIAPPPAALPLPRIDLSGLPAARRDTAARELALEAARQPFDLGRDTLVRVLLLRLDAEVHVALVNLHHIAADGWSVSIVIREIAGAYAAFAAGRAPELPELPIQYADFAVWQRGFLAGPELERQLAFWRQTLAGAPPVLELPADRRRPPFQTFRGGRRMVYLPPELWSEVRAASQRSSATPFMTTLAVFKALLARLTGQEDVLVGSPIANRNRGEIEGLIGFFVNTLVLRTDLSAAPSLRQAVGRVREGTLAAYAHQDLPFEAVVKELGGRDLSRTPLFQVMFSLNNVPRSELEMEGLALALEDGYGGTAKFDFDLQTLEHGGTLTGSVEYNADLFDPTSVDRILAHWQSLLAAAVAEPDRPLVELPLLTAVERQQLVEEWSHGETVPRLSGTLHGLFAAQAARTPAATAVIAGTERLSYGELAGRVRRLAGRLSQLGMGPERIVGVRLGRTAELVVTLLAVLESGAAYLPLDPAYPAERLRFLLADTGAALVVAERSLAWPEGFTAEIPELYIDEASLGETAAPVSAPVPDGAAEEALAYLIYTSGSTGVPKGVAIPHASAVRLVEWALARYSAAELAGVLFSTSTSFDLSIFELFVPLSSGGAVIVADDALALAGLPAASEVTLINTVPSALAGLLDLGPLPAAVRTVNLAGEPLRGALAERIHAAGVARLWNLYGPSEDATYSTGTEVAPGTPGTPGIIREPDIGRPVAGSTAFVLDGSLEMQPVGVPGELCLGGEALARGYLNRPELTAERFVPDPFGGVGGRGSRLYRTGDRARWRPDGALELLGRMDHQVKVRGFRIELGEIEAVLSGHPAVREAAVTAPATPAGASGDRRLVAYVSSQEGSGPLDVAALGVYLGSRLPAFMVPSVWVELAALPLTRTGKVDRQALPAPGETAAGTEYEAPRTATEELLAAIWGDLLSRERVGVHDNFFALGGHSLLATQVVSRLRDRLGVELPVRALFEQPTVAGLAVLLAGIDKGGGEAPIVALPRDAEGGGTFPASFAQRRLWFLDQLEPGSAMYNMPLALSLEGELDEAQLAAVFGELVRRHETLRTTFVSGDDGSLQVVHPMHPMHPMPPAGARPFALASIDLSALGEEERRRELTRLVAEDSLRPFDLASGPLLRGTLVRLAARENALLLNMHHVISDGWSMGVLVREVTALYTAAVAGRPLGEVLPPLPVQYADFSVWQSRWLSGETLAREIEHWRQKLAGVPPFLELPTDRPRPPVQTFGGRSLPLWLEPGLAARLSALALETGTTLFMVLLAAFEKLLGIYSGAEDLAVGTPIAGRNRAELEGLIGFFVNSLVLRADLSGDPSFVDLLGRVREDTLSGYTHQDLPFEKLVEELQPERNRARSPIFQVMLALQNVPMGEGSELPGLTLRPLAGSETAAKYDLALSLTEGGEGIKGGSGIGGILEYNVDLFDAPTMVRLLDHLRAVFEGVAADPGSRLSELPLLGAAERQQLLREWSDAAPLADVATPVHELFAAQAARRPDAVALVSGPQALTYGELARRSSRMACRLAALGVGPGVLVGLCAERSPELILGVLAILAAGGAYLPLDPAHPMERLAYTLADAGAPVLLAEEPLHERLPAGAARVVGLHALAGGQEGVGGEEVRTDPGDLAYVIYTSGSTGRPKGVEVSHANVARLFAVIRQSFAFGQDDVWTLFHSIAFDFSVWELWGALAFGGRLVVVPGETARSTEAFYELLRRERVTVLSQTPSAFRQLLWAEDSALARGEEMAADLRLVVFGGEALDPASLAPWLERHGEERPLLVNMYGITETTVHTTWRRLRQSDLSRPGSPVGRPLSDLALHLLDGGGRPVPIGVPGEIHVGGAGVARGYLARPALTAERFVPDPFVGASEGGQRLYRSGDLARWRPDGDLEYLRRIDRQVKVRGFRIELGEIEAALAEHPGVREAVVMAREDRPGDVRLVGYVSSAATPDPSPQALAAFLAERLPGYMVPAAWVLLDRLPLTANGKVDRAALPAPSGKVDRAALPAPSGKVDHAALPAPSERGEGGAYVAPRSPVEQVLAGIWEEVLGLQRVGVEDDFFALGGHSLIAAQVTSRVLKAFSVELSLRVLFERPTVAAMAAEVELLRGSGAITAANAAPPLVRAPRGTEVPMSFRQEWRWLYDQLSPSDTGNNVPLALTLSGAVSAPALAAALAAEVERHESLRTRFVLVGGKPVQQIDPPWRPPLPFVDLGGLPPAAAEREAARLAALEWIFPFDLARGPLLRSVLLRLKEEVVVLLLTLHHIISDGWSMRVLARELPALYGAAQAGLPSPLPELPIQFRDFAIWQRGWLQGEALERLLGAAVTRLAGMPSLDLPSDRPPSAQRFSSAGTLQFGLDAALTASLSALSRRQGASLFMTVLAAFTGLLRRHTGRGDFPVATITAGRTRAELEPLVGYFTNTLVIRAAAAGDPDFGELLAGTRGATLAAYDHQDLPFAHLVEALRAERPGEPLLLEILFLLQPTTSEVALPDAEVGSFPVEGNQDQDFALVLDLFEVGGGLIGTFRYNQALFDSTTALRWRGHLEALLAGAAADPTRPLTELPLLSEGERHQVTVEWGAAVRLDGGPAPIGIWGEVATGPAGQSGRFRADGTVEASAPAPASPAEPKAAAAAAGAKGPGEPARSLDSLSAAKRKLLAKRIRGSSGAAAPEPEERGSGGVYLAPRSPVEQVLAGIWEEVLGRQRIGVEDDFFALGGHSLIALQVISRVLQAFAVELPLRALFDLPTVAKLAAEIERLRGSDEAIEAPPLVRAPRGTEAPLSFRQEWRWVSDQFSPSNTDHNVPLALTLSGAVSAPALAAALAAEVERHESLRTRFVSVVGKPVQRIDPPWRPPLPFVDLGGLPSAAAEREAARLAAVEWIFPFDVARGPLLRSVLLRLKEEVFVFLLTLHHIISDGWSIRVLARELPALYEAAQAGLPSPLPELPLQFRDFAIWQRGWLQGEALERLLGAAVTRLAGMPRLDLPSDRPPSARRHSSAGTLPFGLDVALTASLKALSRHQEASLFMTVLAAFTGLLRRHTGRGDFPVATITAGRTRAELEPLIGYFTNTLVIRAAAAGDPDFGELLARTRRATLAAYDHQDLPFSLLAEALRAERPGEGEPLLFEVLFHLQPPRPEIATVPDAEVGSFPVEANQGQDVALVLDLVEAGGGLFGTFRYNQALFDSTTALRWRGHLEALLAGAAADPTRPLAELPLLSEGERHQVTIEWGAAVRLDGGPAPIGIWGEVAGAPAGRSGRFRADGTVETSAPAAAPAPEGPAAPAAMAAMAAPVAPAAPAVSGEPGEPARSLASLSAAKRKLLAKRIRGEAGSAGSGVSGSAPAGAQRQTQLLVDLQPERPAAAARPPFFCVHAIGGAVLSYRDLALELSGEQPFYGIQAAGLAGERAVDDLPAMAAQYAAAVEAAAPHGPYLLGGWSFGGVVAFEMARQMRQRGRPVALVALLDSWAPALVPLPAPVREDDVVRLYLRDQAGLQGLDASWLETEPPELGEAAALDWLLAQAQENGLLRANLRPEQIRPILDVYSANVRAGVAYRPQPGGGRLTLFRPGNSPEPTNGWSALADEPVEVHEMAADHYSMLAPPAVAGLADSLRSCIERSLAAFMPEARP